MKKFIGFITFIAIILFLVNAIYHHHIAKIEDTIKDHALSLEIELHNDYIHFKGCFSSREDMDAIADIISEGFSKAIDHLLTEKDPEVLIVPANQPKIHEWFKKTGIGTIRFERDEVYDRNDHSYLFMLNKETLELVTDDWRKEVFFKYFNEYMLDCILGKFRFKTEPTLKKNVTKAIMEHARLVINHTDELKLNGAAHLITSHPELITTFNNAADILSLDKKNHTAYIELQQKRFKNALDTEFKQHTYGVIKDIQGPLIKAHVDVSCHEEYPHAVIWSIAEDQVIKLQDKIYRQINLPELPPSKKGTDSLSKTGPMITQAVDTLCEKAKQIGLDPTTVKSDFFTKFKRELKHNIIFYTLSAHLPWEPKK